MKAIRLDKYLCEATGASRSEVKKWLKKRRVTVSGETVTDPARKITEEEVYLDQVKCQKETFHYVMLYKPAGVVSATKDNRDTTVLDLVLQMDNDHPFGTSIYKNIFPVGRLDKDTEGLLLLTDDGDLSHALLSPKKHVDKCYFALLDASVGKKEQEMFQQGLDIGEEKKTLPAILKIAEEGDVQREAVCHMEGFGVYITIQEGKFHQIKRMAHAIDREVLYLKRITMGSLKLDDNLKKGQARPLTTEEINQLKRED